MEMKWLEDFVSLALMGSFSKAAEHRNISQPAFSRRIQALEDWLGARLVDRNTHPITLTDAGNQLVGTANQVLRTIYQTREDYSDREQTPLKPLSIGVANHLSIHFVPAWLNAMDGLLGNRKISLVTGLKAGLGFVELLKQGELDFLLAYGGSVNSADRESGLFESFQLGRDELLPVCRAGLPSDPTFDFPATPANPLLLVNYMPGSALSNLVHRAAVRQSSPVHLRTVIETGTAETIKALVLAGAGMAWLPRMAIADELRNGTVRVLGDRNDRIPFTIEIFRYVPNTASDNFVIWEKLRQQFKFGVGEDDAAGS